MQFNPPLSAQEVQGVFSKSYSDITPIKVGGQGAVFKAKHEKEWVALKVYNPDHVEERADREIAALGQLASPALVRIHDSGTCSVRGNKCRYVSTTFIDGQPLSDLLRARGPLAPARVATIANDISLAIAEMWTRKIVHRDIKPDNIMITPKSRAVLIDLGVARHVTMTPITTQGTTWGTAGYMSPEQMAAKRALTCHSDVFTLGVVLQECIAGRHPTHGKQPLIAKGGPPTSSLAKNLPPELVAIVDKMVQEPAHLRPTPQEVVSAVATLLEKS